MKRMVIIALALFVLPLPALAHKVIAGVFPSGEAIEGEIGFSDGTMATDQEVVVLAPDGAELGRTQTDEFGFFVFVPAEPVAHRFFADLGAGHVAEATMPAEEVAKILGVAAPEPEPSAAQAADTVAAGGLTVASLTAEERAAIAEIVRDEMRPLRREISALKEHNGLQSILGGIGYIVGLFGVGFYLAARRKLAG